jgi:hypothetical protein
LVILADAGGTIGCGFNLVAGIQQGDRQYAPDIFFIVD